MPQKAFGQPDRRRIADPARRPALLAEMDLAAQEGAGGEDDGTGDAESCRHRRRRRRLRPSADQQLVDLALAHVQPGLLREQLAHGRGVEAAVGLGARARGPPRPCCG